MEKITKELKSFSKVIGFISLYQVSNLVFYLTAVTELDIGSADAMMQTAMPVIKALGAAPIALSILVHLFLCFKGHKEANDPSPAKFHIILAVLWAIGYVLSLIGSISAMAEGVTVMKIVDALFAGATAVLMFFYAKYAKEVRTRE